MQSQSYQYGKNGQMQWKTVRDQMTELWQLLHHLWIRRVVIELLVLPRLHFVHVHSVQNEKVMCHFVL